MDDNREPDEQLRVLQVGLLSEHAAQDHSTDDLRGDTLKDVRRRPDACSKLQDMAALQNQISGGRAICFVERTALAVVVVAAETVEACCPRRR